MKIFISISFLFSFVFHQSGLCQNHINQIDTIYTKQYIEVQQFYCSELLFSLTTERYYNNKFSHYEIIYGSTLDIDPDEIYKFRVDRIGYKKVLLRAEEGKDFFSSFTMKDSTGKIVKSKSGAVTSLVLVLPLDCIQKLLFDLW